MATLADLRAVVRDLPESTERSTSGCAEWRVKDNASTGESSPSSSSRPGSTARRSGSPAATSTP